MAVNGEQAKAHLRLGVLCVSPVLEDWQARCLRALLEQTGVEPAILILGSAPRADPSPSSSSPLWAWYDRVYVHGRSRARQPVDPATITSSWLRVVSGNMAAPQDPAATTWIMDELRHADLDIVLQFGGALTPEAAAAAKREGWCFGVEVQQTEHGTPPCFWDLYASQPITITSLQRVTAEGVTDVVQVAATKTLLYSYVQTLDTMLYATAGLPVRACKDILTGSRAPCFLGDTSGNQHLSPRKGSPNTAQTLRFMLTSLRECMSSLWRFLAFEDQWRIGVVSAPIQDFLRKREPGSISWVSNDKEGLLADPFGVEVEGRLTIVAERFDRAVGKGEIVALEETDHGAWSSRRIFTYPFHISYPYLLSLNGDVYCLPEMSPQREVVLFRGNPFPAAWQKVAPVLTEFVAIDSTVFWHGKHWWLFCTGRPVGDDLSARTYKGGVDSALYVWYAEELEGPWLPHALNPVKVDVRSSRPGGTPFVVGSDLYRPAQDCSRTYGGSVVLNRITCLTPTSFAEESVAVVEPFTGKGVGKGLHTVSAAGERTLVDGKDTVFNPGRIPTKLAHIAGRLLGRPSERAERAPM